MHKSVPNTLLVIKNRALGDSVITLGTIQYLKELLPKTKIIYAVPNWIKPLYDNVNSAADEVISLNFKDMGNWIDSYQILKNKEVDTVLELFQSGRTAKFFKAVKLLGGPKYYFHNHHKKEGPVHDQGIIKSNIQRDLDAAWTYFGGEEEVPIFSNYHPQIRPHTSVEKENLIILGVVATRQTKMWPLSSFLKVAKLIKESHPTFKVVIPLGPQDQRLEAELVHLGLPENVTLVKAPLNELPELFSRAQAYAGNDTGIKHICAALNVPTITLFGPEPPLEWHPYNIDEHPFFYKEPLECRTRNAHYCGLSTCDSMICLNEFKPEEVYQELLKFI